LIISAQFDIAATVLKKRHSNWQRSQSAAEDGRRRKRSKHLVQFLGSLLCWTCPGCHWTRLGINERYS